MNISKHLRTHERLWSGIVLGLSLVVVIIVAFLLYQSQESTEVVNAHVHILPKLNAVINSLVTLLLISGFIFIINRKIMAHRLSMLGALGLSVLFLLSYVTYHYLAPHTSFEGKGMIRNIYFTILISHIILAIAIVPMALMTFLRAFQERFDRHRKIARFTLPVWLYVSLTGVLIYLMISPYYPV